MARPQKFATDQILDAARSALAAHGRSASINQVSAQIGVPVGSIYHRFPSREALFISLWVRSIERFQLGVLEAARIKDPAAALTAAAVHIPRYCRARPADALAMTLYRHQALAATAPEPLAERVRTLNDEVVTATAALCRRRYGRTTRHRLELVMTAIQQCPYGLVRPYVGGDVPRWLDDAVIASSQAILALGDGDHTRSR